MSRPAWLSLWKALLTTPAALTSVIQLPELRREAQIDARTGLFNARYFRQRCGEELERAQRFQRPLALIHGNVDLLRELNAAHGREAGDLVLEEIGKIVRRHVREYDIAGRRGDDVFALILPGASAELAGLLAERLRRAVEAASFALPGGAAPISATMSLGVAVFPDDAQGLAALEDHADEAVYHAKYLGRNRVARAADLPHYERLSPPPGGLPRAPAPAPPALAPPLRLLVTAVILLGALVSAIGLLRSPAPAPAALALVMGLAVAAELRQISVYGDHTISPSLATIVAGGLLAGMPGVVATSAAVALADQLRQRRPARDFYKVLYNCATHVLSAVALVLAAAPFTLSHAGLAPLLLVVAAAGALYFGVESLLIGAAVSLAKGVALRTTWQGQLRWLLVHYVVLSVIGLFLALAYATHGVVGVIVFTLPMLMMSYAQQQYVARTQSSVRELRRMNQELTLANHEIRHASGAIQQLNDELFEMLARFYDTRDPYAGGHSAQVADYATAIARELQLPPERIQRLRQAALLHDIGKIAISEQILFKPARLTEEEYEVIKRHPGIGARLLELSQGLGHLAPFVRHHHERWDGKGYPAGLKGEEIPFEARILNLCDAAEAMASDRPYSRAMSREAVLHEVRRNAGSQFDPEIAAVFIRIVERELEVVNSAECVASRLQAQTQP